MKGEGAMPEQSHRRFLVRGSFAGLLALAACLRAEAQPFTMESINPVELVLTDYRAEDPKLAGRISQRTVTQEGGTAYYFVKGVSVYSPTYVGLSAPSRPAGLQVSLHKETWESASVQGQLDSQGNWHAAFRTYGDFGLKVATDGAPATYAIVVWVGKEVSLLPLPSPFVPQQAHRSRSIV